MSILQNVAVKFETFAAKVVADAAAELAKVAGQVVDTAIDTANKVADDVSKGDVGAAVGDLKAGGIAVIKEFEGGFLELVDEFGQDVTVFVHDLMSDVSIPTGNEKANLAATMLVDAAAVKGVAIAAHDVTTLVKNAFLAVEEAVAAL